MGAFQSNIASIEKKWKGRNKRRIIINDAVVVTKTSDAYMRAVVQAIKDIDQAVPHNISQGFMTRVNDILQQNMSGKYSAYNDPEVHEALEKTLETFREIFEMKNSLTDPFVV